MKKEEGDSYRAIWKDIRSGHYDDALGLIGVVSVIVFLIGLFIGASL